MAEKPILFSGPMVRAILDGRKTQTRRVIPTHHIYDAKTRPDGIVVWNSGPKGRMEYRYPTDDLRRDCPYGVPGDRLWVRESIRRKHNTGLPAAITYSADDSPCVGVNAPFQTYGRAAWKWKRNSISSRFMPRWASRILLEITDIRVQRAQEISEEDTIAEGVDMESDLASACINVEDAHGPNDLIQGSAAITVFSELWDSLNAKRGYGWESNPFVWAITFNRVKPE